MLFVNDGLLLVNSSIVNEKSSRDDIEVVYVPCNAIAEEIGNTKGANVVFLGAYLAKRPEVVDVDTMIEAIRDELGPKKAKFLEGNIKALHAGMDYVNPSDRPYNKSNPPPFNRGGFFDLTGKACF